MDLRPASFDPGGAVLTDVPGGKTDTRNGFSVEYQIRNTGANTLRYSILGSPDDVTYETLVNNVSVNAGNINNERLTRDQTTHRYYKIQVRRDNAANAISDAIRAIVKGDG